MQIKISGKPELRIENAVFDFNGTIALDGRIKPQVRARLFELAKLVKIYVLTADTNKNAREQCADLPIVLRILTDVELSTQTQKADFVSAIGSDSCVCFGNGFNDIEMFKAASLSIAVLGEEGICAKLLPFADILVKSMEEGIDLLFNTNRIVADLRS